jgi:hypothetical protein
MSAPEFLICLNCETPCYTFEWEDGELKEALCVTCGNEDAEQFATSEEAEALQSEDEDDDEKKG